MALSDHLAPSTYCPVERWVENLDVSLEERTADVSRRLIGLTSLSGSIIATGPSVSAST